MKRGEDYVIDNIDKAINELVFNKYKLLKAYNYYNGKRDAEQFRYLEENFGIGNPTSIEFTPLLKKHIDALLGEYLDIPILPKISCKDSETVTKISREKELYINKELLAFYNKHLNSEIIKFLKGAKATDNSIDAAIEKLKEDLDENFLSQYEIAAQDVIEYVIQSETTDLLNKLKDLLLDLLVTGQAYYRVKPSPSGTNLSIETLNPLNTFVERNPESRYVKDSYRIVIRKWMTKQQILNIYGKDLSQEGREELDDMYGTNYDSTVMYIRSMENLTGGRILEGEGSGLEGGTGIVPGFPADTYDSFNYKLLPVFEVEWIDVDQDGDDYIQNRYSGVKIGLSIYVTTGKVENVVRTKDAPTQCSLSVNGVFITNRDNIPQSLVLQCAALLDKYDLIQFFRDNVIANSGTDGDWLDVSMLPTFLGADLTERVQKWIAIKKSGTAIVDTSQEGRAFNNNTSFAGFSDALKVQTMLAFDLALERIETQVSSITGVFRERLNGILLRDAVSNVEAGARNSYIITKPFYQNMDTLVVYMLGDCLNVAKKVWKKGITGTIILGDKLLRIFTALPEYFTYSDYDIHITPSTLIMKEMLNMLNVIIEMLKAGQIDADITVDAMTARSLTELKSKVTKGYQKKKKEMNQVNLMSQLLQLAQQQIQQLLNQLQQSQAKLESLNEAKLQIERDRYAQEANIKWFLAKTDREFKVNQAANDTKRTDIEYKLLFDGNNMNNEVRNI